VTGFDDSLLWMFCRAGLRIGLAGRAAYARPPSYIDIFGESLAFGIWVNRSGHGAWPAWCSR
jgi:hypothetical protein